MLSTLFLKDLAAGDQGAGESSLTSPKPIVFLGFFREASSIIHEFELSNSEDGRHSLLDDILVINLRT